jgi:Zn finger protein HypA/HybF involved in hydrogenase expression
MKSEYRAECPKCKEVFAGDDCWTYCPICGVLLQVIKLAVKPLGTAPGAGVCQAF